MALPGDAEQMGKVPQYYVPDAARSSQAGVRIIVGSHL